MFSDIDFSEIMALCNVLYDDPYFAAYTDIGIKIFKIIRDWPISMTFDEKFYYRARIVDDEFAMPLAHEMMQPPEDIPSQGDLMSMEGVVSILLIVQKELLRKYWA